MIYLFKGGILHSNTCKFVLISRFNVPRVVQWISLSTSSPKSLQNSKKVGKTADLNNPGELQGVDPLFNEILGILGTDNIVADKNSLYGFFISKDSMFNGDTLSEGSSPNQLPGVCGNAEEITDHTEMGNLLDLNNNGNGVSDLIEVSDVSPIVHRVTEIVRCEKAAVSMEERLENVDIIYNEEVVEKVLKRCFKVPHLALRFFNWVKFREEFQHTTNTYNVMINVAREAKNSCLVEELAQEMEKSSCKKNVKTWTLLVSHYGSTKVISKALLVFEEMKRAGVKPDATAYWIMLRALCNSRKADIALEFYKDMVHNEVNLDVGLYKLLLKCFALSGNVDAVHLVGENMINLSEIPQPHVYGFMLKSFCIAGRIRESLELIRDLKNKNIFLDAEMFETLVKGLCSRGRVKDAMEILEIMKKRGVVCRNMYEVLISTYLRSNEVSKAFDLFQDAKRSGNISVSTYTNLMQHLFWMNEYQKGLELYNEMLQLGIQLDHVAITAVAVGHIQQNCVSEACEVFKSMNEKGIKPTSKSYTVFIKELCKVCKTDEIVKVLNAIQVFEVKYRDDIFRQVQSYLEKNGETEKMNTFMQIQRGPTINPESRKKLNAEECSRSEVVNDLEPDQIVQRRLWEWSKSDNTDIQEVCKILSSSNDWYSIQESLDKLDSQFTPDLVVEILRNSGLNIGIALKFFSWVGKQTRYSHNEQSYNMAIKVAGQGKNFKEMRSLFYEMRRRGCSITPDTWTIMIMQYGRTGLTDIALSIFGEMKLSGCKPVKSTYDSLITSLCGKKGRKVDEAILIYQEMLQSGFAPDKKLVEVYLGCLCEINKLSDARSSAESLPKFGFSIPLSYSLYFRALCRAGKLEDASALMDEIGPERNLVEQFTYGSFVHALLRRGRLEEALVKINCMKQVGILPTVHVYTDLMIHFFKEKNINRALETIEEMKEQGCQPTVVTYSAMICGYVRLGKVREAWDVFHHLKQNGPSPDFKTYSMMIDCLCSVGMSEEAFRLVSQMLDDGIIPSTINFRTIMYGLNREGKPEMAKVVLMKKLGLKRRRKLET
ncbi:hypothetical protein ACS0TY_034142 [Phlomoides rotata]